MDGIKVVRWTRYGKDRLYVEAADGSKLGWVDLVSGARNATDPGRQDAFDEAVNRWYVETAGVTPPADVPAPRPEVEAEPGEAASSPSDHAQPQHAPSVPALPPAWHDLATHVPGQAAREQAQHELAAMKERTRVGTFIARALDMKTDERAWRVGAGGEETVGAKLEKLTKQGWRVLHAVPVGKRGSDIDHVLIGPGGVYTINTKNHPEGRVWVGEHAVRVNGHSVPYLRNSRHEAERAGRLLSAAAGFAVPVQPALVFLTGTLIPNVTVKNAPVDVRIFDRMDIPGVFKRAPRRIADEEIQAIYEAARRCTTWTEASSCVCSPAQN